MSTQSIPGKKYVANEIGFSGERWPQHRREVEEFIELMRMQQARSYLEIGCLNGDTLHFIGSRLPKGSRIVGVDKPRAHPLYAEAEGNLQRAAGDLRTKGYDAQIIIGDSRDKRVIQQVWRSGAFDAILIDGDHTAAGVRADWMNYSRLGRIIGFHDAFKIQAVRDFYNELAHTHNHHMIVLAAEVGIGIGVIFR